MKTVVFETTTTTQDWAWQYRLLQTGHAKWEPEEAIVLSMSPDFVQWNDYGWRQRSFPPTGTIDNVNPFFQASSDDNSGVVRLTDPNLIDVIVPWNRMREMGPGTVHVSLAYWRGPYPEQHPEPVEGPPSVDPTQAKRIVTDHELRVMAKRRGVSVQTLIASGYAATTEFSNRVTLVVGTLPVADGVG
jgi:hypothetical protein